MNKAASDIPAEGEAPWPAPWRGWLLVVLLALASVMSQFDRTVINLMVAPIKQEFGLNDTGFGALQGLAFGLFYVIACIPLGRAADNLNRKYLIGGCLLLWSLFSMGSGLARSYFQLFLTRIGVAVGEASLTPAGLSMLSDHFPPQRLGRPVSGFLMSAPVGQGLAFIGGGSLLSALTGSPLLESGPLAGLDPWQAAFLIVGAPGLLLVPLFLLIGEPERRGSAGAAEQLSVKETARIIGSKWRALVPMFIGFAMVLLVQYSLAIWTPALLERTYGWNSSQIGWGYGLVLLACGATGVSLAGVLSDWLFARGHFDAPLKVSFWSFAVAGAAGTAAPLMPTPYLALALIGATTFFGTMPFPCAATALQLIVPNRARAQISAIYVTFTTMVGLTVGPTVIGIMTDYVFRDPNDIRYSMSAMVAAALPIMLITIGLAMKPYRRFSDATTQPD